MILWYRVTRMYGLWNQDAPWYSYAALVLDLLVLGGMVLWFLQMSWF